MRKLVFGLSLAAIVLAAAVVPLPLLVLAPAPATDVASDVIRVTGRTDQLSGRLLLTTVAVEPATASGLLIALLDSDEKVVLREQVIPSDVQQQRFFHAQREVFDESVQVAAAVGLREAGRPVSVAGRGARIERVVPGGPAAGTLRPGDVVVAVDGRPIRLATELAAGTARASDGQTLTLTIRRNRQHLQREVRVGRIPDQERVGLGVLVRTVDQRIQLTRGVKITNTSAIGGPSAGLMLALTVYDLFEPTDLTRGRVIAGTGTVDLSGAVGSIGGIREKVRGAVLAGATVFLSPAEQAAASRAVAPPDLTVIPVSSVRDAITKLGG